MRERSDKSSHATGQRSAASSERSSAESGGEFDVAEAPGFQRAEWRVQRIGWALMALILVGAIAGAFGRGPLARATLSVPGGASIEYERIARHDNHSEMVVHPDPSDVSSGGELRVWLDRAFLRGVQVEHIEPEADRMTIGEDRVTYIFTAVATRPAEVVFTLRPDHYWTRRGRVGVGDSPPVEFTQFVLP